MVKESEWPQYLDFHSQVNPNLIALRKLFIYWQAIKFSYMYHSVNCNTSNLSKLVVAIS